DPVRTTCGRAQLLKLRQQALEECGPALERDAKQVDNHALSGLGEHIEYFGGTRLALGITQQNRVRNLSIIAFRIDDAELILAIGESFQHAGCKGRFATS